MARARRKQTKTSRTRARTKARTRAETQDEKQSLSPPVTDLNRVEFHRHGLALVPDTDDPTPGIAFFLRGGGNTPDLRMCSCPVSRRQTCPHILSLVELYKNLQTELRGRSPDEAFRSSIWYRVATIMADRCRETPRSVRPQFVDLASGRILRVTGANGEEMLWYLSRSADAVRFLERLGRAAEEDEVPNRGGLLDRLALMTLTSNERVMSEKGFKSHQQVLEESFWYRLAYHGFREFGGEGIVFSPAIEETSGAFNVTVKRSENEPVFRMIVPPNKVKRLLAAFKEAIPNQHGLTIHPVPHKSIFKISATTELDLEIRSLVRVLQENGEAKFFEREDLERFRYGDLVYVKELGILAELESGGKERRFLAPVKMVLKKSQVPSFLQEHADDLRQGPHIVDAVVKSLKIYDRFHDIEITPDAMDRDWCWLSAQYGLGNLFVSLSEILCAKKKGQRYLATAGGWVDCQSEHFDVLDAIVDRFSDEELAEPTSRMNLSRLELLRLNAVSSVPLKVAGNGKPARLLEKMLEFKPAQPLPKLEGLTSFLRPYQKLGSEWLVFLYENGLGGLLCDDMGLGKTHQVMALMLALREHGNVHEPFLVVCPTTVLSHWREKILAHAPGLAPAVFHGGQRNLEEALRESNVLITSYGILRNDIDRLQELPFALAVLDEIQNLKNPQTLAYEAAAKLGARMKLGLTGTPIENRLSELKALFDLTIPGYLGTDQDFEFRYVKPMEIDSECENRQRLSNLIAPFKLRRLKRTVLEELPEKIEDIRTCALSDDQVKLYRDAISSRAEGLVDILEKDEEPVPYIHIFALLNLLKQICDHPALVEKTPDDFERYESGKWELFRELLGEALDSGQKVVVYSQFLGMIAIIGQFLHKLGVGFVTLTGGSRDRGRLIARFNQDPECRVFVGSLKAGGVGIDLVAASVVIHYDRWWNAAKEDQATDRVHRIGQRRGVQVFKLVTEGTLEEKISAIIERKRRMMDSVMGEDDPGSLKVFSREELIEMLSAPEKP